MESSTDIQNDALQGYPQNETAKRLRLRHLQLRKKNTDRGIDYTFRRTGALTSHSGHAHIGTAFEDGGGWQLTLMPRTPRSRAGVGASVTDVAGSQRFFGRNVRRDGSTLSACIYEPYRVDHSNPRPRPIAPPTTANPTLKTDPGNPRLIEAAAKTQ